MRALAVTPGLADSLRLLDLPEPSFDNQSLLVQCVAMGVCGTDVEIAEGRFGVAPPGLDRLVIGHESLGRVLNAPSDSAFRAGDLVVGIVRRPDPVPCRYCAAGEWDMCRNGRYTERGIKECDGYGAERFLLEPAFAIVRNRVSGRRVIRRACAPLRSRRRQQADGARKRRRVRIGQRQSESLRTGGRGTGPGGSGLVVTSHHPPGTARALEARIHA